MKYFSVLFMMIASCNIQAWEANVTQILYHTNWVAIYLSPDPGPLNCEIGSPYLLKVDDTIQSKQLFTMLLTAQTTGQKIIGYHDDPCMAGIWGKTRPTIKRLNLLKN